MKRGCFITLEGGEGCGKTTQVSRLYQRLLNAGVDVILTREPGGTRLSEMIRALLKDEEKDPPCDRSELLLFLAARAQLVNNVIRPALEEGKWVVSDRFSDSTLAYQGYGRGLSLDFLRLANDFACDNLKPDLTLLLDLSPEVAASRMRARAVADGMAIDRIERAGNGFHDRLHQGFLSLAEENKERIKIIDASISVDDVESEIWTSIQHLL